MTDFHEPFEIREYALPEKIEPGAAGAVELHELPGCESQDLVTAPGDKRVAPGRGATRFLGARNRGGVTGVLRVAGIHGIGGSHGVRASFHAYNSSGKPPGRRPLTCPWPAFVMGMLRRMPAPLKRSFGISRMRAANA